MCDETTADAEEIVRLEIGDSTRARLYDLSPTPYRHRTAYGTYQLLRTWRKHTLFYYRFEEYIRCTLVLDWTLVPAYLLWYTDL